MTLKIPIKVLFFLISILCVTACSDVNHYALGPIEDLEPIDLPVGMLPAAKPAAREEAQMMVLWLFAKDIDKTKSNPPAMLRGLAYLEYLLNDILQDLATVVSTKKSIKKIVLNLRDALGMPLYAPPRKIIKMYWSTAKFMKINKFTKLELAESVVTTQENLSEVKSLITLAIVTAKLNMITAQNQNISKKLGIKELKFEDKPYIYLKNTEPINFDKFRTITSQDNKNFPPKPWSHWSRDLKNNLNSISEMIEEKRKFFSVSNSNYEKDFYKATAKVFQNILNEDQNTWITLQKLQKLSDFMALSSLRLPKKLVVDKKRNIEVQTKLRALTPNDFNNLRQFLLNFNKMKTLRLNTFQQAYNKKSNYLLPAIHHLDKYKIDLNKLIEETNNLPIDQITSLAKLLSGPTLNVNIDDITREISKSSQEINNTTESLNSISSELSIATESLNSVSSELGYAAGQYLASIGGDLQTLAETIATAIHSGITTDLNAMSQGMGYSSFAAAVVAYNAQYGTSYTTQQAIDALSGK